jgi:hypothetical protein
MPPPLSAGHQHCSVKSSKCGQATPTSENWQVSVEHGWAPTMDHHNDKEFKTGPSTWTSCGSGMKQMKTELTWGSHTPGTQTAVVLSTLSKHMADKDPVVPLTGQVIVDANGTAVNGVVVNGVIRSPLPLSKAPTPMESTAPLSSNSQRCPLQEKPTLRHHQKRRPNPHQQPPTPALTRENVP